MKAKGMGWKGTEKGEERKAKEKRMGSGGEGRWDCLLLTQHSNCCHRLAATEDLENAKGNPKIYTPKQLH